MPIEQPVRTVVLDVPAYTSERGLWRELGDGRLSVAVAGDEVTVRGDREGLLWLAVQLLALAGEGVPDGYHHHIDRETGELTAESSNLIIEYAAGVT
jgi:hypothetical protein